MTEHLAKARLFTIGHSNHPLEKFLDLLNRYDIDFVIDVRSSPFSRYNPQYNGDSIADSLREVHVKYQFMGVELGARRSEPECYEEGKASYQRIAMAPLFQRGLEQVLRFCEMGRVALLCAEKDPATCHRSILVCRHLRLEITPILHILEDGRVENHVDMETRLLALCKLPERDLFTSREDFIEHAYDLHGNRIAYVATESQREDAW